MTLRWLARGEPGLTGGQEWLSEMERSRAASMSFTKRRSEYLVARWTLKHAVAAAYGWEVGSPDVLARVEARHAVTGAPRLYVDGLPAQLDVSLTDRAGWAVCVLGPAGSAPGVDLELVEPRSAAFVADYLTAAEQTLVASAASRGLHDLVANLLWSAKESALKVLQTGLRRDTRSVEVSVDEVGAPEGEWSRLVVATAEGETFPGWWRRTGSFVLTTCARVELPPPESLDEPPALDAATPLHTWMTRATV